MKVRWLLIDTARKREHPTLCWFGASKIFNIIVYSMTSDAPIQTNIRCSKFRAVLVIEQTLHRVKKSYRKEMEVEVEHFFCEKLSLSLSLSLSHFCLKWKKVWKISHDFWKCGVVSRHIACHAPVKLSLDHYVQVRYGNPDMQILGTLKIKLQIFSFLSILSKNMRSDLIFRVFHYQS